MNEAEKYAKWKVDHPGYGTNAARAARGAKTNTEMSREHDARYPNENAEVLRALRERVGGYVSPARAKVYIVLDELKDHPCMDCGGSFPIVCMDFDHRDRATKISNISRMVLNHRPLQSILDEIAKCDLICSNCHRIRTFGTAKRSEKYPVTPGLRSHSAMLNPMETLPHE
jgi:hypothetical protein